MNESEHWDWDEADVARAGESMGLFEWLRTTRAIRRLKPDPVPISLIRKVCEAGTFAPSGGNRQPWMFVAVSEEAKRAKIAELYRDVFDAYIGPAVEAAKRPEGAPYFLRRCTRGSFIRSAEDSNIETSGLATVMPPSASRIEPVT